MNIYLIRHSEAVETSDDDRYRHLSAAGRAKAMEVAKKMKQMDVKFDIILTSPHVRAVQSAEITSSVLDYLGEVIPVKELLNGTTIQKFTDMLKKHSNFENIACFGHAPDLSIYVKHLMNMTSMNPLVELKKSAVCALKYDIKNSKGKLLWLLDPKDLKIISPQSVYS